MKEKRDIYEWLCFLDVLFPEKLLTSVITILLGIIVSSIYTVMYFKRSL